MSPLWRQMFAFEFDAINGRPQRKSASTHSTLYVCARPCRTVVLFAESDLVSAALDQ